jgi:hypothetical protein
MKNLLRAAAVSVASTALVAGGATVATAAPSTAATTVSSSNSVSAAAAPFGPDRESKIRLRKVGKKLTIRLTARYFDDTIGKPVGIRKATVQIHKKGKWRTLKNVKLNSKGRASFKRTDGKTRKYRMLVKPTSLYQGFHTRTAKI